MRDDQPHRDSFKLALRFIDQQRKILVDARADSQILDGLTALVRHLYRLPDNQVDRIFGRKDSLHTKELKEVAIQAALEYSLEQVERLIDSPDTPRRELEAVAIGRFHVPRGSMRSMGNSDLLRERLRTFVLNERTHASISELARR